MAKRLNGLMLKTLLGVTLGLLGFAAVWQVERVDAVVADLRGVSEEQQRQRVRIDVLDGQLLPAVKEFGVAAKEFTLAVDRLSRAIEQWLPRGSSPE